MNLPLSRDSRQGRGGHGRSIKAKHHAVGIDSPHAGIDRTGLQVRDLEVQAAFRRLGEGTAFGFAHRELIQPSRYRSGSCIGVDPIAENVPAETSSFVGT